MYKLFSQMSDHLLRDINDNETLINLAKIISSFNMTKNNSNDIFNSPSQSNKNDFDSKSIKINKKNTTYDADFVFNDLNDKSPKFSHNIINNKLPKMNKSNPSPFPTQNKKFCNTQNNDNGWEFEWLGKDQNQRKKSEASRLRSTLPSFVRTDSEDEFDDDVDDDYEEIFSINNKFKMNQIFSNNR